jgi:glutathione S-transferase
MAETGIRFMTFGISPYCEKARWALDWHRIRYREIGWPPGLHQILAKRCGAKTSALPILLEGTTVIQGSSAIIDWAERRAEDHARSLAPSNSADETQEIDGVATKLPLCMFGVWPSPRCCQTMRTS